jgi:hypothetical protein
VNSRGEQDRRREELDGSEVPVWEGQRGGTGEVQRVMKKLAGEGLQWAEDSRRNTPRGEPWRRWLALPRRRCSSIQEVEEARGGGPGASSRCCGLA